MGAAVGAAVGGAAGATLGFFSDLGNTMNGGSNWTPILGGAGLLAGGAGGAAIGAYVSNPLVGAIGGAIMGGGAAFISSIIAKEAL